MSLFLDGNRGMLAALSFSQSCVSRIDLGQTLDMLL
jgi:hypothetical protein